MRSLAFSREMFPKKENRMLRGTTSITAIRKKLSSFRNLDTNSVPGYYLHILLIHFFILTRHVSFVVLFHSKKNGSMVRVSLVSSSDIDRARKTTLVLWYGRNITLLCSRTIGFELWHDSGLKEFNVEGAVFDLTEPRVESAT